MIILNLRLILKTTILFLENYFYADDLKSKIYEAELIQPVCPFCGSVARPYS